MQHAIGGVAAVAAIHGLFHDTGAEGGISGWDLLSATCMTGQIELDKGVELLCQSSSDTLPNDVAMPLALVAKELIGNAARYGRNGRPKMLVRVSLRREPGGYAFTVEDDGPGFTLEPEHARSFGLGLVMALARQLNGELEVSRAPRARPPCAFPILAP
jgi:two-component sensor histidine kinase